MLPGPVVGEMRAPAPNPWGRDGDLLGFDLQSATVALRQVLAAAFAGSELTHAVRVTDMVHVGVEACVDHRHDVARVQPRIHRTLSLQPDRNRLEASAG